MNWPPPKKYNLFFIEQPALKLKIFSAPPKTQNSKISANPLTLRGCILCCRSFPQNLGQVQVHIILYFTKIKTVCFMILCLTTLVSFCIEGSRDECSNFRKMLNCKYFLPFGSFSPSFWAGEGLTYIKISWNDTCATYIFVISSFDLGRHGGVLKHIKDGEF